MNVTANITRGDVLVVNFKLLFRLPANLYLMLLLGCALFGFTWLEEGLASVHEVVIAVLAAIMGAVCGLLGGFVVSTVFVLLMADKKGGMLGMHDFSISPAGVEETTAVNKSLHAWAGIRNVIKLRSHVVIVINAISVHAIPRRAFASPAQFDAFFEQAVALRNAAKALQPSALA